MNVEFFEASFVLGAVRDLCLLLTGAALTLGTSLYLDWRDSKLLEAKKRRQIRRLRKLLWNEVEQIAETLEIDLRADVISVESGYAEGVRVLRIQGRLDRLRDVSRTRILFDAYVSKLADFDRDLPNNLVKFYARLPGYVERLEQAHKTSDAEAWEKARMDAYNHAEVLKQELSDEDAN